MYRTLRSCILLLTCWLAWSAGIDVRAQGAAREGARAANQFFDQFFPAPNEADERALAEIQISLRDEQRFGEQMVEAYLAHLKRQKAEVTRRGPEVQYLEALVKVLQPQMRNARRYPDIAVYVVDSPEIDARSFPGGHLFFFTGMLDLVDNEAALIGVVGHELSHLDNGHQLIPLKQSRLMQTTFIPRGGFDPQQFFSNGMSMMRMMSRPFRPQDEASADRDGAVWAFAAGYDPRELGKLLIRMHEQQRGGAADVMPAFFRTHPPSLERSEAVFAHYAELRARHPQARLYIGRENLERRIPRSVKVFPE